MNMKMKDFKIIIHDPPQEVKNLIAPLNEFRSYCKKENIKLDATICGIRLTEETFKSVKGFDGRN